MLACRRAGVKGPTLIRDESGAALDPQNARNYVAMLRRAAELVGASHVLFVSHSPEVQELADARIVVQDGEVTVAP
jgi:ABC-type lipoprotein export system ATPase subunit